MKVQSELKVLALGALCSLLACAGNDADGSGQVRVSSSPLAVEAEHAVRLMGREVDFERLVREGDHFRAERLDAMVRREALFLEVPSLHGLESRPAVLWLPRRPVVDLADRFALVVASQKAVDPHYSLAWSAAGAFVLDLSPGPVRSEVLAAAARVFADRFALPPQRVGLDLHSIELDSEASEEGAPPSGPLRDVVSFPFGFGLQRGGDARELAALLPEGVAHQTVPADLDPRFESSRARDLHRPRFAFVEQVLTAAVPDVQFTMRRVVAGRWAQVELWSSPSRVQRLGQRAMEDAERIYAETQSVAAALDAGLARLRGMGVRSALMEIGSEVRGALGPPEDRAAFDVPLPTLRASGEWAPSLTLRDGALVQVGGLLEPLPTALAVCVQAPSARKAEQLADAVRTAPDVEALRELLRGREGFAAWLLLEQGDRLQWRPLGASAVEAGF